METAAENPVVIQTPDTKVFRFPERYSSAATESRSRPEEIFFDSDWPTSIFPCEYSPKTW